MVKVNKKFRKVVECDNPVGIEGCIFMTILMTILFLIIPEYISDYSLGFFQGIATMAVFVFWVVFIFFQILTREVYWEEIK